MSEVSDGPIRPFQQNATLDMHHLTAGQLASLGVAQIAYVRPVIVDGAAAFSIHAADGTPMALTTDLNMALAAVVHHELIPALVH